MNIRLILEYDGSRYHGWQIQPNAVTVQETVTKAIEAITGEKVILHGCGRTDSGVHAINYTANFLTQSSVPPQKFKHALNSKLPPDIRCKLSDIADPEFHSSRSATGKTYIYRILNSTDSDVFERNYTWHYKYQLDIPKMRHAAASFLGEHDFIGFASSGFSVKTTVRTIYDLAINQNGKIINIIITGNGFLYNMVRIIAGTLVMMGNGKLDYTQAAQIINSCDRSQSGITAPPQGLFLKEVYYNGEEQRQRY